MCWCCIYVTVKLVSGTTQRSVIESCITNVSSSPPETVRRENLSPCRIEVVGKKMRRVCLWDTRCAFLKFPSNLIYWIDFLFYKLLMSIKIEIRGLSPRCLFLERNRLCIFPGPTEFPQSPFACKYYQTQMRPTIWIWVQLLPTFGHFAPKPATGKLEVIFCEGPGPEFCKLVRCGLHARALAAVKMMSQENRDFGRRWMSPAAVVTVIIVKVTEEERIRVSMFGNGNTPTVIALRTSLSLMEIWKDKPEVWGHLGSLTAANWVSFDFNVAYSSWWGYSLINTLKLKK